MSQICPAQVQRFWSIYRPGPVSHGWKCKFPGNLGTRVCQRAPMAGEDSSSSGMRPRGSLFWGSKIWNVQGPQGYRQSSEIICYGAQSPNLPVFVSFTFLHPLMFRNQKVCWVYFPTVLIQTLPSSCMYLVKPGCYLSVVSLALSPPQPIWHFSPRKLTKLLLRGSLSPQPPITTRVLLAQFPRKASVSAVT